MNRPIAHSASKLSIHIGNDARRLEDDSVSILTYADSSNLLHEIGNVVGEAEEVLLELIWPNLASDLKLRIDGICLDRAAALDDQKVAVGDAVEKDDTTVNLELVSSSRKVPGCDLSVGRTTDKQAECQEG